MKVGFRSGFSQTSTGLTDPSDQGGLSGRMTIRLAFMTGTSLDPVGRAAGNELTGRVSVGPFIAIARPLEIGDWWRDGTGL